MTAPRMNLRDALARRLGTLVDQELGCNPISLYEARVVADECIRQMEWARRIGEQDEGGALEAIELVQPIPDRSDLTIAPEGWKP